MKKRLALIISCVLATSAMVSCGNTDESVADSEVAEESTEETETEAETEQQEETEAEVVSTSAPTYGITSVTADGYDYFVGTVQCVQITDDQHENLKNAIDEYFTGRVNTFNESIESTNEEAKQFNEENKKAADEGDYEFYEMQYEDDLYVDVVRADSQVFSILLTNYTFMGGAHGSSYYEGVTFDCSTGDILSIDDFGDATSIAEVSKDYIFSLIDESDENAKSYLFDSEGVSYKDTIEESFADTSLLPSYYLSARGLVFVYQQYDIAPYAAGMISFTVPYSQFSDFNESYIPGDEFYTCELSNLGLVDKFDINNDGNLVNVTASDYYEEDGSSFFRITVGDNTEDIQYDENTYYSHGNYIHSTEGNFLLVCSEGSSYTLYDISNGIKEIDKLESELSLKEITENGIVLGTVNYSEGGTQWSDEITVKYSKSGLE